MTDFISRSICLNFRSFEIVAPSVGGSECDCAFASIVGQFTIGLLDGAVGAALLANFVSCMVRMLTDR